MNLPIVPKGTVYRDGDEKLRLESRNGIIQVESVLYQAANWNRATRLTPDVVRKLQELAVNQIYRCAGYFRDGDVRIDGVKHQPPPPNDVPGFVQQMCDYVHDNWNQTPVHLASYLIWRINWIHPFFGGNGRTARAVSYLILCAKLGFALPGTKTIPELIVESRKRYIDALQTADAAWDEGRLAILPMEDLMAELLAEQLVAIHEKATGRPAEFKKD
ncbi:MAG TPA: Fic family protein [Candidatus Limnocylindrales bacterium]|nr:Fic family protein [Candidatus Limnocylindrales bacterium]